MKKNISNAEKLKEEFYKGMQELGSKIERLAKKTDAERRNLEELLKKTDAKIDKTRKNLEELFGKTDAKIDKTRRNLEELFGKTDARIDNIGKMVGKLTDGWGKFVEGLVEPSIPVVFKKLGIDIIGTSPRNKRCVNGKTIEIDILAIGKMNKKEEIVIVVEVKSDLGVKEIKECEEDLNNFFEFFSEYRGRKLIGAVAGIRITKAAVEYAGKKGLYILSPSGNIMTILNKEGFKPKIYTV